MYNLFFIYFFVISSNFTYNKAWVLPVTKDEMEGGGGICEYHILDEDAWG